MEKGYGKFKAIQLANYKKSNNNQVCPDCFFNMMGACVLWDFMFANDAKCDRWGTMDDYATVFTDPDGIEIEVEMEDEME